MVPLTPERWIVYAACVALCGMTLAFEHVGRRYWRWNPSPVEAYATGTATLDLFFCLFIVYLGLWQLAILRLLLVGISGGIVAGLYWLDKLTDRLAQADIELGKARARGSHESN